MLFNITHWVPFCSEVSFGVMFKGNIWQDPCRHLLAGATVFARHLAGAFSWRDFPLKFQTVTNKDKGLPHKESSQSSNTLLSASNDCWEGTPKSEYRFFCPMDIHPDSGSWVPCQRDPSAGPGVPVTLWSVSHD